MILREARSADAKGVARVHVESWRTTYSDLLPADFLAALDAGQREARWRQIIESEPDHFLLVVEDEGREIVGFANGGPSRDKELPYAGEVYAIYLLKTSQQQGIGRKLIAAACETLAARGMNSLLIWVLADNPSRGFYEALGGKAVSDKDFEIGGQLYREIGYGWPVLPELSSDLRTSDER